MDDDEVGVVVYHPGRRKRGGILDVVEETIAAVVDVA